MAASRRPPRHGGPPSRPATTTDVPRHYAGAPWWHKGVWGVLVVGLIVRGWAQLEKPELSGVLFSAAGDLLIAAGFVLPWWVLRDDQGRYKHRWGPHTPLGSRFADCVLGAGLACLLVGSLASVESAFYGGILLMILGGVCRPGD